MSIMLKVLGQSGLHSGNLSQNKSMKSVCVGGRDMKLGGKSSRGDIKGRKEEMGLKNLICTMKFSNNNFSMFLVLETDFFHIIYSDYSSPSPNSSEILHNSLTFKPTPFLFLLKKTIK